MSLQAIYCHRLDDSLVPDLEPYLETCADQHAHQVALAPRTGADAVFDVERSDGNEP